MFKRLSKIISLILVFSVGLFAFACVSIPPDDNGNGGYSNGGSNNNNQNNNNNNANEDTPFVIGIRQPEGILNPFFASTPSDRQVVDMTQISLLTTDVGGRLAFGSEYPTVTQDLSVHIETNPAWVHPQNLQGRRTVYQFVLKPDIVFSDGTPLTIKDVLFNFYMRLDPAYTGSSAMNSVPIIGLRDYRTQFTGTTEAQANSFRRQAMIQATTRVNQIIQYLTQPAGVYLPAHIFGSFVEADLDLAIYEFKNDLNSIWNNSLGSVEDMRRQYFPVQYDWETFMMNVGLLGFQYVGGVRERDANNMFIFNQVERNGLLTAFAHGYNNVINRENGISLVYRSFVPPTGIPRGMANVLRFWPTAGIIRNNIAIEAYAEIIRAHIEATGGVPNISGIRALTGTNFRPSVESHATIESNPFNSNYQMLQITIDNVDPSAIWSFGLPHIAPMHWYSTEEQIRLVADDLNTHYTDRRHFGVEFNSLAFINHVRSRNSMPLGAGPYRFVSSNHDEINLERNKNFLMGAPRIRRIKFQSVSQANVLSNLADGTLHFAGSNATQANINEVNRHSHLRHVTSWHNGYGYIGISAAHIPEIGIRRAIMTAIDTRYVRDYFPEELSAQLHRGMSFESWIHRDYDAQGRLIGHWANGMRSFYGTTPDGVDIDAIEDQESRRDARLDEIERHLSTVVGMSRDINRNWHRPGGRGTLQFTFNVDANSTDHPAWVIMERAAELLNANGWNITVRLNNNVTRELAAGRGLEVWASERTSNSDPNMFNLWHRDSTAASVRNWGYDTIINHPTTPGLTVERGIVDRISAHIDLSRSVLDQASRTTHIRNALDTVMELAVELPTYQRVDMFVINTRLIDQSSLEQDIFSHFGPLSRIWLVSFN